MRCRRRYVSYQTVVKKKGGSLRYVTHAWVLDLGVLVFFGGFKAVGMQYTSTFLSQVETFFKRAISFFNFLLPAAINALSGFR